MRVPKFTAWDIAALERLVEDAVERRDARFEDISLAALLKKLRAA